MQRNEYFDRITQQLSIHPVVVLLGPRQAGKTTLARAYVELYSSKQTIFFDLENPLDLARFENPLLALGNYENTLIIIDEVQMRPELFPVLRVLADDKKKKLQFLILGSASRDLIRQSSETLAGRVGHIEVTPFSLREVRKSDQLWIRGGFPPSYLADSDELSMIWRESYIRTYLERDIPLMGFAIPPPQIRRFWLMLCSYHGQIFNGSEIGKSLGITHHTSRKYLDILIGTFMIRSLQPWFENIQKRQVKSPKIYFRDSGVLHALLGLKNQEAIQQHPRLGSFWEGFALEEIIRFYKATEEECYFWATQSGAELDLLLIKEGKKVGFEIKYTDSPKITPSMKIALHDLKLDHLYVIFPSDQSFPLDTHITAQGLENMIL